MCSQDIGGLCRRVGCTGVGENPSPPSVRPESTHLWYHKTNYSSLQSLGGSVTNNQSVGYSCLCCYRSFSQLRRRTKLKHNNELKSVKNFSRCIFFLFTSIQFYLYIAPNHNRCLEDCYNNFISC